MRHFRCHRNSSFLQCEFKSFYILPNIAHSGLNSPSTRSQTISGFIYWIICELFVIFRIKSVTQTRECNRTSLWFESQLKQHSRSSIESSLEDLDYFPGLSNLFADILPQKAYWEVSELRRLAARGLQGLLFIDLSMLQSRKEYSTLGAVADRSLKSKKG